MFFFVFFFKFQALIGNFAKELLDLALKLIALIPDYSKIIEFFLCIFFSHENIEKKTRFEKKQCFKRFFLF